ncbi:MAG TPA: hypothetical protein VF132_12285 [Rudaea sp.]
MRARLVMLAACACNAAFAADGGVTGNYQMSGVGTLKPDPVAQSKGNYSVRAVLQPKDAALGAHPLQETGRFALIASLTAAAHVCYNDTIFRDDFDGDGG